ncbi:MAG: dienelactone hydrolase family protein [Lysobacteraceae bacterium]
MGHPVSLSTSSGRIGGWRADPPFPPRGAIVLVQEIFGVNSHIRHQVERFAAHGFTCLAPALFDHFDHHVELPYDEAGVARGRDLVERLGFERALADVEAAVRELSGEVAVGVLGYCWGGTLAFLANTRLGLPAVSYYGARTLPFVRERLRAPMQFHFGETDPLIPPEAVAAHREAHPEAKIYLYPAGHGFNCDERADFEPDSARLALDRTVNFFTHALKG